MLKTLVPLYYLYNSLYNPTHKPKNIYNIKNNNNRGIFFSVFLHPLRNPRQCKNKPFIGLQLVVM